MASIRRKYKKTFKGGYYPSIMANLLHHGKILIPLVFKQGNQLFNSTVKRKTRKNRK